MNFLGRSNFSSPSLLPPPVQEHFGRLQNQIDSLRDELDLARQQENVLCAHVREIDQELRLAARVQRDFLPRKMPEVGQVRFSTLYRPATYVSGDLYDVARLDEQHVGFYIADAVGHGMAAALLTIFIKQAIVTKEITAGGYRLLRPAEVLARLNDAMLKQELSSSTFATAVYGIVNTSTLDVTIASAGHPKPLLMQGKQLEAVSADGPLLGVFPDAQFTEATAHLAAGERLVLFSDGVEQLVPPRQTWSKLLSRHARGNRDALLAEVDGRAQRKRSDGRQRDDLTIIIAEAM